MQPRSTRPRFWIALQPSIVRLYKAAGLVALTAILVGLVGFLVINIYYFFDHTWVRPVVLSPTHQRVVEASTQLFEFTRVIARHFSPTERIALIEMLCEVMYADGALHDLEASLLRRVGELVYVSDRDRGAARLRVMKRLGIA